MRLTQTDASFIYSETASGPMHISSVYILEGELAYEKVLKRFEAIIHKVPAYRRKLVQIPMALAHPKWVDDPNFDIKNHVVEHKLPAGTNLEEGVDVAVTLNQPLMDRNIPLWKMVVLTGVEGKTILLQMTHHALIDGASGIEITTILYDLDPKATDPEPSDEPWNPEEPPSRQALISEAFQENIAKLSKLNPVANWDQLSTSWQKMAKAREIMQRFISNPVITAPFNAGLVGPTRKVKWLKKSFGDIREIRRELGGTINDIVLAVVSETIARYLVHHNERVSNQHMRIMCPVNVRTENQQGALGNQVSAIYPTLAAWPMETRERLAHVIAEMERIKTDGEAQAMTMMQDNMPDLPPIGTAATQLVGTPLDPTALAARIPMPIAPNIGFRPPNLGINFTCTNVPGIQVPQYMCGHEVTDTIGLLVLMGNIGFSLTIMSYNKQLFFNFICEPRLLPDLELIKETADEVFEELLATARKTTKETA